MDLKRNEVTEEEIDTEYNDSEFESGDRASIAFTINSSIPTLNPLDSSSDDYRFATGKNNNKSSPKNTHKNTIQIECLFILFVKIEN